MISNTRKWIYPVLIFLVVVEVWTWNDVSTKPASDELQKKVPLMVAKDPALKPLYDEA